jgi:hypothetical protein
MPAYVDFFRVRSRLAAGPAPSASEVLEDERIAALFESLREWPGRELKTHKDVTHPIHRLAMLADLGFTVDDPGVRDIVDRVFATGSPEGPFEIVIQIPTRFGGTGAPMSTWTLCDATVVAYALLALGADRLEGGEAVGRAVEHLADRVTDHGWECCAAESLGRFRGPGRKEDPCPYGTLYALKMLSQTPPGEYREAKASGIATVFDLWDRRRETKPYLFGMGSDFRKLKLPFVWYDVLAVLDTLSSFPEAIADPRFGELMEIVRSKKGESGYTPESIYLRAKAWDFGQKKQASPWMNAVVERLESRVRAAKEGG